MIHEPKNPDRMAGAEDVAGRIRSRRRALGMKAYELAREVGVSPSWISLIESGSKVPSEEVAARIATALGEDPDLYRIWAGKARLGEKTLSWVNGLERWQALWSRAPFLQTHQRIPPPASLPKSYPRPPEDRKSAISATLPTLEALEEDLRSLAERGSFDEELREEGEPGPKASPLLGQDSRAPSGRNGVHSPSPADLTSLRLIPLLSSPDTIPPHGNIPTRAIIGQLPVDARILPESSGHLVALEVNSKSAEFVRTQLGSGDLVIVDLEDREVMGSTPSDHIFLVRTKSGLVFARCVVARDHLILQPDNPETVPELLEVPAPGATISLLAGRVIWAARRFGRPQE